MLSIGNLIAVGGWSAYFQKNKLLPGNPEVLISPNPDPWFELPTPDNWSSIVK
jgi:hypothetical protein